MCPRYTCQVVAVFGGLLLRMRCLEVLQEMSENARASVVSSSIFFNQSWLAFVTFLSRLDYWRSHQCALVVTETQDVHNVLDVSFKWGKVEGVYLSSRRSEVTVLRPRTHWLDRLQLESCSQNFLEPCQLHIAS